MPVINKSQLQTGNLTGADHGATISLIVDRSDPGQGPRLHSHPYDETWVVIDGNLTFHSGEERLNAGPGDVVIVPPGTPHKFVNDGPGRAYLVCIHASPTFVTEWLEQVTPITPKRVTQFSPT
jgi:quercetin dioxygenase-like cupin family protein